MPDSNVPAQLTPDSSAPSAPLDRRCSEAEVLQHMLEVESSRHRLERYARDLSRLAEHSVNATREARLVAQKKSDLIATLSHEMRTPLNGILGMAQVLGSRPLPAEDLSYVDSIRQAGEGLLALMDEILDFSKMEADKLEIETSECDLRRIVQDAFRIVQSAADRKALPLITVIDSNVPATVFADQFRVRQIILNFLSNAIKFTETGSVTLRVEALPSPEGSARLRFSVIDNGIGISPEGQARLFQPFTQADASIARRFGGTGLGLAICKRLVELMGGTIGVDSRVGLGSSFWFTLPVQPCSDKPAVTRSETPSVTPIASATSPIPTGLPRILLIEDNVINQRVATLLLKRLGYTAAIAENGLEGSQAAAATQYDLILMDCSMPEMDGFQATRVIRQGPNRGASIPIIAMTANAYTSDREACLAAGMSDYLAKPVREIELKDMLEKWLVQTAAAN